MDSKPLRLPLEKASNGKRQPFAAGYLFRWQPWPSATFAVDKLFRQQKVAAGQGFCRKRLPSATFTVGKGFRQQRLPMAIGNLFQWQPLPSEKVTNGNLFRWKMLPAEKVADGNLFRWKLWPTATFCRRKRFLAAKVADGQGCH